MPQKIITLKSNHEENTIKLTWGIFFRNFVVYFNDKELGRFENISQLNKGKDFTLPNGDILTVKKTQKIMTTVLETLINGQPIEGSATDPKILIQNAYYVGFFLCGVNLALGSFATLLGIQSLLQLGFGPYNMIIGSLYLFPALIGFKNRSWVALCFILAVFLFDTVSAVYWIAQLAKQGVHINAGSLVVRFIFAVPLFLGAKAGFELKDKENQTILSKT